MTLLDLARQIARSLGPGWSAHHGYMVRAHAVLLGRDQQALSITHGDDSHRRGDHGRLRIRADYGELARHLHYDEGRHVITVAANRPATVIAAEITRRLLPDYHRTLDLCRARAAADALRLAHRDRTLTALIELFAPARLVREDRVSFGRIDEAVHGSIRVLYSGDATVEMHVAADHVLPVARAISPTRPTKDTP